MVKIRYSCNIFCVLSSYNGNEAYETQNLLPAVSHNSVSLFRIIAIFLQQIKSIKFF